MATTRAFAQPGRAHPLPARAVLAVGFSLVLVAAAVWPQWAGAQTTAKKPALAAKASATRASAPVAKSAAKPVGRSAAAVAVGAAGGAVAVAAATPMIEAPLTDNELAVATQVHVGALPCELGKVVRMERDATTPGFFRLHIDQQRYRLRPVESRTGAVRLEDVQQGVVWIQLANKSMLMSQKLGRRLADECAGESQQQVAAALKLNPAPSLLDPLPVAAATTAAAVVPPTAVAVSSPVAAPLNLDPVPVPAVIATDCRRPANPSSLLSGAEPC